MKTADSERILGLDMLRAIAILMVLGRHIYAPPADLQVVPAILIRTWFEIGWAGVDLFFVLSGFLVSGLLFKEHALTGSINIKRFLIRRGFKIYPAFYALLLISIGYYRSRGETVPLMHILTESFFLQNYTRGVWWHTWSLAVEEHYYFLLAFTVYLSLAHARNKAEPFAALPKILLAIGAGCLTLRIVTAWLLPFHESTHLFPTHLRIDSLMAGTFVAYAMHLAPQHFQRLKQRRRLLLAVMALASGALLAIPLQIPIMYTLGYSVLYMGSGALLIFAPWEGWSVRMRQMLEPLAFIGRHSYSIYLWHVPAKGWLVPALQNHFQWPLSYGECVGTYLFLSVGIGVAMSYAIETPFLKLRERLVPSRQRR